MKKFVILSVCLIVLFSVSITVYAKTKICNNNNENMIAVRNFINSDDIYDLGLYSNPDQAVEALERKNSDFLALCSDYNTIHSLNTLIENGNDDFLNYLMTEWYVYLIKKFNCSDIELYLSENSSNYEDYDVSLPGGKVITGQLYTGSSTPENYKSESKYSTATKLLGSSYRYNCTSYAWYLHGDANSHTPQLNFESSSCFRTLLPSCATKVSTPKVGDIAVYYNRNTFPEEQHSAIITSVSSGTSHDQITVKSKWGIYGVYSHKLSDCPYYFNQTSGTTSYQTDIEYYRLSHLYVLDGNYYYCKGCGYKNPTMVTSASE